MARGRESKYVKKITGREEKLFKQLARTGLTDRVQAKTFCNLNPSRLKKLENSGYIKLNNYSVKGISTEIIRLDNKGKDYCTRNLEIKSFGVSQINHLTHDLRLSATYYALSEKVQETWVHERQIIKEIYDKFPEQKNKLQTCIDAKVTVNGVDIAIEVIGDSYTQKDIQLKEQIGLELANCQSIEYI